MKVRNIREDWRTMKSGHLFLVRESSLCERAELHLVHLGCRVQFGVPYQLYLRKLQSHRRVGVTISAASVESLGTRLTWSARPTEESCGGQCISHDSGHCSGPSVLKLGYSLLLRYHASTRYTNIRTRQSTKVTNNTIFGRVRERQDGFSTRPA